MDFMDISFDNQVFESLGMLEDQNSSPNNTFPQHNGFDNSLENASAYPIATPTDLADQFAGLVGKQDGGFNVQSGVFQPERQGGGFNSQSGVFQPEWNGPSEIEISVPLQQQKQSHVPESDLAGLFTSAIGAARNTLVTHFPSNVGTFASAVSDPIQAMTIQGHANVGAFGEGLNSVRNNRPANGAGFSCQVPAEYYDSEEIQPNELPMAEYTNDGNNGDEDYEPCEYSGNDDESATDEDSGDPIRCNICDTNFGNKESLRRHKARTHTHKMEVASEDVVCKNCSRTFANAINLKRHISNAHKGEPIAFCNLCPATFSTKRGLALHKNDQHHAPQTTGSPKKKRQRNTKKIFSCTLCAYTSTQSYNVRRHFDNLHMRATQLPCPYECGRISKSKANLQTHLITCKFRSRN